MRKIAEACGEAGTPAHTPLLRRRESLYLRCRATDYGATGPRGISAADPGAVPGASTSFAGRRASAPALRSEEQTSELQSLMRSSYAVFCLNNKPTTSPHDF